MIRTTKADYLEDPKSLWCARLPALVSKSINALTYRQFNYATHLTLPNQLSRWFHKRMSHNYVNADMLTPYNILYSSIERDSGLLNHSRKQRNIATVDDSLKHLKEANIIWSFQKEGSRRISCGLRQSAFGVSCCVCSRFSSPRGKSSRMPGMENP